MQNSKKLNKEISLISRYAGLKYSKYVLLILLAIIYFPMRTTPTYIFLAAIFTPMFLGLVASISQNQQDTEEFALPYTAEKYNFTTTRYKNEKYGYLLNCFLLLLWQANINLHNLYIMPLKTVPAFIIIVYTLVRIVTGIFIKYKIKYGFINLNL
ncbi:MAG: hypothetical protein K2O92_00615 [Lachnospiraceae bacterium]|nr:hypothetical protein [Lachnospiraceae bacterium]